MKKIIVFSTIFTALLIINFAWTYNNSSDESKDYIYSIQNSIEKLKPNTKAEVYLNNLFSTPYLNLSILNNSILAIETGNEALDIDLNTFKINRNNTYQMTNKILNNRNKMQLHRMGISIERDLENLFYFDKIRNSIFIIDEKNKHQEFIISGLDIERIYKIDENKIALKYQYSYGSFNKVLIIDLDKYYSQKNKNYKKTYEEFVGYVNDSYYYLENKNLNYQNEFYGTPNLKLNNIDWATYVQKEKKFLVNKEDKLLEYDTNFENEKTILDKFSKTLKIKYWDTNRDIYFIEGGNLKKYSFEKEELMNIRDDCVHFEILKKTNKMLYIANEKLYMRYPNGNDKVITDGFKVENTFDNTYNIRNNNGDFPILFSKYNSKKFYWELYIVESPDSTPKFLTSRHDSSSVDIKNHMVFYQKWVSGLSYLYISDFKGNEKRIAQCSPFRYYLVNNRLDRIITISYDIKAKKYLLKVNALETIITKKEKDKNKEIKARKRIDYMNYAKSPLFTPGSSMLGGSLNDF